MRGAILYGPRDVRFEERDTPTIAKPTDAIIRALEKVAEAQKARAVGVDGQLALAEQLLQEAATT